MFQEEMPPTHFEVQSYDCQVVNPNYLPGEAPEQIIKKGKNMAMLVITSGILRVGHGEAAEKRAFSETVLLVPNFEAVKHGRRGIPPREWLIQNLTFRLVV